MPLQCGNRDSELDLADAEKQKNQEKGPHFIPRKTTNSGIGIKEKDAECPDTVFPLRIVGPSQHIGESQPQALNPNT